MRAHRSRTSHDGPRTEGISPAPGKVTRTQLVDSGSANPPAVVGSEHGTPVPSARTPTPAGVLQRHLDEALGFVEGNRRGEVQPRSVGDGDRHRATSADPRAIAAAGVGGGGQPLPHGQTIQAAFGDHDISGIRAHVGGAAAEAARGIGASAYATGQDVAFAGAPDLHTAAHEAAHVVQQRAGVHLPGGVGRAGDAYERNADAVADRVVRNQSAADLLPGGGTTGAGSRDQVQRQPPTEPPPAGAATPSSKYLPTMRVEPHFLGVSLGEEHNRFLAHHTNRKQAPPGAKFWWSASSGRNKVASIETPNGEETPGLVVVRPYRPGRTAVNVSLLYAPEGRKDRWTAYRAPPVELAVWKPSATWSITRKDPGGLEDADPRRVTEGDTLVVTATMNELGVFYQDLAVEMRSDTPAAFRPRGPGMWMGRGIYQQSFAVVGPCRRKSAFEVYLGKSRSRDDAVRTVVDLESEMDRTHFLEKCSQADSRVLAAKLRLDAWLGSVCNAYASAWEVHTKVLKDQDASDRLLGDIILTAALTFVAGGVGGLIGEAMRKAGRGAFMVDAVKDLAKLGIKAAGSVARPRSAAALAAFPPDPLKWRGLKEQRVNTELAVVTEALLGWRDRAGKQGFSMNFDPDVEVFEALKIDGTPVGSLRPVDEGATALKMEKGFWTKWLEHYAYTVVAKAAARYPYPRRDTMKNTGSRIAARCKELGIDHDRIAHAARQRARREADKWNRDHWGDRR